MYIIAMMVSKIMSIYYFSIIGSSTYMFYNDLYCNYYVNKKIPMVGFINVGTFVGAFLGYNIHNLLTNNN